jgi:hypothetical protein
MSMDYVKRLCCDIYFGDINFYFLVIIKIKINKKQKKSFTRNCLVEKSVFILESVEITEIKSLHRT